MSTQTDTQSSKAFTLLEATFSDIQDAYAARALSVRELVQAYLERIEALDRNGPGLNSIISVNPRALEEADRLDAAYALSGPVGPLHGLPLVMKDQADVKDMPTTMGSVLFREHMPEPSALKRCRRCWLQTLHC